MVHQDDAIPSPSKNTHLPTFNPVGILLFRLTVAPITRPVRSTSFPQSRLATLSLITAIVRAQERLLSTYSRHRAKRAQSASVANDPFRKSADVGRRSLSCLRKYMTNMSFGYEGGAEKSHFVHRCRKTERSVLGSNTARCHLCL